jgi:hypothetical protein
VVVIPFYTAQLQVRHRHCMAVGCTRYDTGITGQYDTLGMTQGLQGSTIH